MIEMQGVGKTYATDSVETKALVDVSMHVAKGEFVAILGPSGSGKTTLLSIVGLLENFDHGHYTFCGEKVSGKSDKELARLRNRSIGFVFQTFNLIPDLTVSENVELPLLYAGSTRQRRMARVNELAEFMGLSDRLNHYPRQLSGGQQQRTAICRAIATEPDLLLLDEPTGNLDSNMAFEVMNLLEKANKNGTALLMVTHDERLAKRASRQLQIVDGRIV